MQAGCGGERGWGGREEGVREGKSEIDVVEEEGCERKVGGVGSGGGEMWGALVWELTLGRLVASGESVSWQDGGSGQQQGRGAG